MSDTRLVSVPSSDDISALIAVTIRDSALCWRCIAFKCSMTALELDDALQRFRREVAVTLLSAPCDGCRQDTLLYRLA